MAVDLRKVFDADGVCKCVNGRDESIVSARAYIRVKDTGRDVFKVETRFIGHSKYMASFT